MQSRRSPNGQDMRDVAEVRLGICADIAVKMLLTAPN